jgi:F-type H+-transporting ATPase subunit b
MLAEARMESEKMLDKAKADIAAEQRRAEDSVRDEISKLAIAAARKIIKTGDQSDAGSN